MRLTSENQILNQEFRTQVQKEIESKENLQRKKEMKRRYEVYNDLVRKHVIARLESEMDGSTVSEMVHRAANISICKKIIDKKARVYKNGVVRKAADDLLDEQLVEMESCLKLNNEMKKVNRYMELFRNVTVQVLPVIDEATGKYKIKLNTLAPHYYDVIEDAHDPTQARVYILSYFRDNNNTVGTLIEGDGRGSGSTHSENSFRAGNASNEIIADAPNDFGFSKREYIWWSDNYHFTTDESGNIISDKSPEDLMNPVGVKPFVDFHKEQDGQYWSMGGEDLIEGSILINLLLTDLYFIAKVQGMGLFYAFGKGIPKTLTIGPNKAIVIDMQEGDPTPQIGFASSSPPIDSHMKMIEQYTALLLSTNNLEPSSISGNLSATNAASGIQELIQKSELTNEIEDDQELYRDNEPELMRLVATWMNLFASKKLLHPKYADVGLINPSLDYTIKFPPVQAYMSEKDKLDMLQLRYQLGLDSMIDILMLDNPDFSRDEAEEKLMRVLEDKLLESRKEIIEEKSGKEVISEESYNEKANKESSEEENGNVDGVVDGESQL